MAIIYNDTIIGDGNTFINAKNKEDGSDNIYTITAFGSFGGGTITIGISPDGTNVVNDIDPTGIISFTSTFSRNITINSDELNPNSIVFSLSGSTNPSINIKVTNVS